MTQTCEFLNLQAWTFRSTPESCSRTPYESTYVAFCQKRQETDEGKKANRNYGHAHNHGMINLILITKLDGTFLIQARRVCAIIVRFTMHSSHIEWRCLFVPWLRTALDCCSMNSMHVKEKTKNNSVWTYPDLYEMPMSKTHGKWPTWSLPSMRMEVSRGFKKPGCLQTKRRIESRKLKKCKFLNSSVKDR